MSRSCATRCSEPTTCRWRRARRLHDNSSRTTRFGGWCRAEKSAFTIEGQEAFVANKGFLVQVPYRNIYQLEAVGTAPALFFEVKVTDSPTMYPADETPVPEPGMEFVKVRISGKANYSDTVRPFLDFHGDIAAGRRVAGAFVSDPRAFANVIRGMPQATIRKTRDTFTRSRPSSGSSSKGRSITGSAICRSSMRPRATSSSSRSRCGTVPTMADRFLDASGHERLPAAAAQLPAERRTDGEVIAAIAWTLAAAIAVQPQAQPPLPIKDGQVMPL